MQVAQFGDPAGKGTQMEVSGSGRTDSPATTFAKRARSVETRAGYGGARGWLRHGPVVGSVAGPFDRRHPCTTT